MTEAGMRKKLETYGQEHVLRYWDELTPAEREDLSGQIAAIDFDIVARLTQKWVLGAPEEMHAAVIEAVSVLPIADAARSHAKEACEKGEEALRDGRVGLVLVAGGQGTRLGFDGPKGTFPIGPLTGRTLFEYHADKILNARNRYGCTLPWYIMVGKTNEEATVSFFREHDFFGLGEEHVAFFKQAMMPCVGEDGKFLLDTKGALAMNPNGHGGCIPALVENGIVRDARERGIDTLSYFQVDNWGVKVADPFFIGYHLLGGAEMSSKIKRKTDPRESSGVFCRHDGTVGVIEYTEFDLYPQLLETDAAGLPIHFAANAAIHVLSIDFIERVYKAYDRFPWHCSHKKIAYIDEQGVRIEPESPNGYKFETFVFDALEYAEHEPVLLEIDLLEEFAPTKQMTGSASVEEARASRTRYWRGWLEAAGCTRPLDGVQIEISPAFAFSKDEFVGKARGLAWPESGGIVIEADGTIAQPSSPW